MRRHSGARDSANPESSQRRRFLKRLDSGFAADAAPRNDEWAVIAVPHRLSDGIALPPQQLPV
jgi:hypothetical protein